MAAVSRAFAETPGRTGLVFGVVPSAGKERPDTPKPGYPNEWVEVPIRTHLHLSGPSGTSPLSRNHIVALTAAVVIALPGGPGTASEVRLALQYRRPVIAHLNDRTEIEGLPEGVPVEPDLDRLTAFVADALAAARRAGG